MQGSTAAVTLRAARAGRFSARVLGGLTALLLLFFVIGEGLPAFADLTWDRFLCELGIGGLCGGLVVAIFWQGWGGMIAILGWLLFAIGTRTLPGNPLVTLAAAIAVVHVLSWLRLRAAPVGARKVRVRAIFWVALGAFVSLRANEALLNPPLMTPSVTPPAGAWSSPEVNLTIAFDRSVTGTVGCAGIIDGQFLGSRTWFGRLMHWRTEYMIRGSLPQPVEIGNAKGIRFTAPLNVEGEELPGALFFLDPRPPCRRIPD